MCWMWLVSFGVRCFSERCILEGQKGLERVTESNSLLLQVAASSNPFRYILKIVRVWSFSVSVSSNFQLSLFLICSYSLFFLCQHCLSLKILFLFAFFCLQQTSKTLLSLYRLSIFMVIFTAAFHVYLLEFSGSTCTHQLLIQRHYTSPSLAIHHLTHPSTAFSFSWLHIVIVYYQAKDNSVTVFFC